jgi:hypothetical protein
MRFEWERQVVLIGEYCLEEQLIGSEVGRNTYLLSYFIQGRLASGLRPPDPHRPSRNRAVKGVFLTPTENSQAPNREHAYFRTST